MKYYNIISGTFLERPNRFVAKVQTSEGIIGVHVPNTGRCKELLKPGSSVFLEKSPNPDRKYPYTLVSVYKGDMLVHIVSVAANTLVAEALAAKKIRGLENITDIKREQTFGNSRFDFSFTKDGTPCFMEVKGVTLEENGVARFPDAPTERGTRHIRELIEAKKQGYGAYLFFVLQMKGPLVLEPNVNRDPAFAGALSDAATAGVGIMAYDCNVTPTEITLSGEVPEKH